jgi:hypothetical protein
MRITEMISRHGAIIRSGRDGEEYADGAFRCAVCGSEVLGPDPCTCRERGDAKRLIVSRHPAAVEFIRVHAPEFHDAPVLAAATAEDVDGAIVAGNLPLHLAALAAEVVAVEFAGQAPRGAEYGLAEMEAAGAHLRRYRCYAVGGV